MADTTSSLGAGGHGDGTTRRDFLILAASAVGAVGAAAAVWPLINSMNPAADTLALSSTEADLTPITEGQRVTVLRRGKPLFISHRTPKPPQEPRTRHLPSLAAPQPHSPR